MAEASFAHNSIARHHDSHNHNDFDQMLPARTLARRHGISGRTLDRRVASGFYPAPDFVTHGVTGRVSNRFWWFSTVLRWEKAQTQTQTEAA